MSGKQLVALLKKSGWAVVRINGSHHILRKGEQTLVVPVHGNTALKPGILNSLSKEAGLK
ncbi:MAG: type II toxin-antitoxin system HicA family toxin [Acidobacteriota bacterium]|nr:type II toxin-antitoxin system HicA family toxin [Acidobacteriota bacterium]